MSAFQTASFLTAARANRRSVSLRPVRAWGHRPGGTDLVAESCVSAFFEYAVPPASGVQRARESPPEASLALGSQVEVGGAPPADVAIATERDLVQVWRGTQGEELDGLGCAAGGVHAHRCRGERIGVQFVRAMRK